MALIRALIFGAMFVVLAGGAYWLAGQFLPELLSGDEADTDFPGSRVNISVEDDETRPGAWREDDMETPAQMASLADTAGLDQVNKDGYTNKGEVGEKSPGAQEGSDFGAAIPSVDLDQESVDILPDLDSMGSVFFAPAGNEDAAPQRSVSGNKPEKMDGDFNPKEMAAAIQTILKREDKG
jgi:hypothetical protein